MAGARQQFENVDEYIGNFPQDVQPVLQQLRQTIRKTAPGAVEMISYQIPAYKLNGKVLIYFAAFKNHVGMYPRTHGLDENFKVELAPYMKGKATIQFLLSEPIPYDLVKRIVEFRMTEKRDKKTKKQ